VKRVRKNPSALVLSSFSSVSERPSKRAVEAAKLNDPRPVLRVIE